MMEAWATATQMRTLQGRRTLDTAEGVLIGLRRCDAGAAFDELVCAAQTHDIPVFSMAAALVELATDNSNSADVSAEAQAAAQCEWGQLLDASPKVPAHNGVRADGR
jgi:hypothetical protein